MHQDEQKALVAKEAVNALLKQDPPFEILGIGTGSTVNLFIDALAPYATKFKGVVSSSQASTERLLQKGFTVLDANDVMSLDVYIDGADEINEQLHMLKGGGGALTREKIVASVAQKFICIADESKLVQTLGRFPLPIEVLPLAREAVARVVEGLGGAPVLRAGFITDNGNQILDVKGLSIVDPVALEQRLNQVPGVVTNGLFATRSADVALLATQQGIRQLKV